MYSKSSGEDIWKTMEIFLVGRLLESHWDQFPRTSYASVAISGVNCEMGFMDMSAKLYSFPNCLYICCLMWKELSAIKINKHCSQISYKKEKWKIWTIA